MLRRIGQHERDEEAEGWCMMTHRFFHFFSSTILTPRKVILAGLTSF
jgi:hypothetical protein